MADRCLSGAASIATTRLRLDPLRADDADAMFDVLSDPSIYTYVDESPPRSVARLRERYARLERGFAPDGSAAWLNWVVRNAGDRALGYLQATVPLAIADADPRFAWIAYVLAAPHRGRGFAREAVAAMLAHLVDAWDVREARATVEAANVRSIALLSALAFVETDDALLAGNERLYVRRWT